MEKTTREGYLSSPNKYVQLKNKSAMKYVKIMKGCWMMNLAMMFLLIWCSIPLCRAENLQEPSIEFVEKNIVITSRTGRIVPCRKGEYCPMYTITADDWPIRIKCTENGKVSFHAELNVIKNCDKDHTFDIIVNTIEFYKDLHISVAPYFQILYSDWTFSGSSCRGDMHFITSTGKETFQCSSPLPDCKREDITCFKYRLLISFICEYESCLDEPMIEAKFEVPVK